MKKYILTLVLSAASLALASPPAGNIRLPESDVHWKVVKSWIEATPDPDYSHASEAAYEAFRDTKFDVRIHWGIYTLWQLRGESWPILKMSNQKKQEYQQLYKTFNPTAFNAEQWMELFEKSGIQVFAITTKHHEGFSLFDTKTRVKRRANWTAPGGPQIEDCDLAYSVMDTPFKRDIIRELTDAGHRHNLKIDLYFSHPDWDDADFRPYGFHPLLTWDAILHPWKYAWQVSFDKITHWVIMPSPTQTEMERGMKRHRDQLIELLSNYGKIDMVCLDQPMGPAWWPYMKDTIKILRKLQPDVMLRARGIGNYGDYYTPEGFVPGNPSNTDMPWMVIYPLGRSFSYEPEAKFYKGTRWIITNLIDSAAKGGSFMVGIGPDATGKFHPEAEKELLETGQWLKVNGEGIYATRMWQSWNEGDNVRFTRSKDGKIVYAFSLEWPGPEFRSKLVKPAPGSQIFMLGVKEPLKWHMKDGVLVIEIPYEISNHKPCQYAWAIKIVL